MLLIVEKEEEGGDALENRLSTWLWFWLSNGRLKADPFTILSSMVDGGSPFSLPIGV